MYSFFDHVASAVPERVDQLQVRLDPVFVVLQFGLA